MKKVLLLLVAMTAAINSFAQEAKEKTLFYESFGTPTSDKNEPLADHVWDNNPGTSIDFIVGENVDEITGDVTLALNVRSNNPSNYEGASGSGNLYFNNNKKNEITFSGINTSKTENNTLSFGVFGKGEDEFHYIDEITGDAETTFRVKYYLGDDDLDGVRVDEATIGKIVTAAKTWYFISGIALPKHENLKIRFYAKKKCEVRIDDVKVTGTDKSGVETILTDQRSESSDSIYDLQGRKLQTPPESGLYIQGGKVVRSVRP